MTDDQAVLERGAEISESPWGDNFVTDSATGVASEGPELSVVPFSGNDKMEDSAAADPTSTAGDDDTGGFEPSEGLLEAAHYAQISTAEARQYSSETELAQAIRDSHNRPSAGGTETKAPDPKPVDAEKAKPFEFTHVQKINEKDEDGNPAYEEGFRLMSADLHAMQKLHVEQIDSMQTAMQEAQKDAHSVRAAQRVDAFDAFLDKLPTEYEALIGKGRTADLIPNSPQARNRQEIVDAILVQEGMCDRAGRARPSIAALAEKSMNIVFADHNKRKAISDVNASVKKNAKRITSRPKRTEPPKLSTEQSIEQKGKALWAERGLNDG